MIIRAYELAAGVSWLAVTPSVLRYLRTTAETYQEQEQERPDASKWERFVFALGAEHPVYRAIPDRLPRKTRQYAYYLRVPDLAAFVHHVTPVLEARLASSVGAGHSGELRLGFYRDGLRLVLDKGRIATVEAWNPGDDDESTSSFPGLTFLQILFGYRSLAELEYAFPDCRVDDEDARVLLDVLFPRQVSHVWPLD
jgi:hypothetical protein